MNNFTEQDRIEQFKEIMKPCMPNRFTKEFINILKKKIASSQPRLPFTTTGHIRGRCSIIPLLLPIHCYISQGNLN